MQFDFCTVHDDIERIVKYAEVRARDLESVLAHMPWPAEDFCILDETAVLTMPWTDYNPSTQTTWRIFPVVPGLVYGVRVETFRDV